ncbi:hydrophobic surface binding protein A-domain-containing protein [Panaeolus papilionaceus]|nr:hydrophobic surface binding protein A-domain-containing protein [Panaeolus papilionaceus]
MKLSSVFVILPSVIAALATTPAQIVSDIQTITAQTQALDIKINAITTSNTTNDLASIRFSHALAVHNSAVELVKTVNGATTDAKDVTPNPISEADGTSVLNAIKTLQPVITTTLNDLVAKRATIAASPISGLIGLVLQDLKNLNTATGQFETGFLGIAPAAIKLAAAPYLNAINNAFTAPLRAFLEGNAT